MMKRGGRGRVVPDRISNQTATKMVHPINARHRRMNDLRPTMPSRCKHGVKQFAESATLRHLKRHGTDGSSVLFFPYGISA